MEVPGRRDLTFVKGYLLLVVALMVFVLGIYVTVVSKFMPATGNLLLDFIRDDCYYSYALPCVSLWFALFTYINWLSMKFFRHN